MASAVATTAALAADSAVEAAAAATRANSTLLTDVAHLHSLIACCPPTTPPLSRRYRILCQILTYDPLSATLLVHDPTAAGRVNAPGPTPPIRVNIRYADVRDASLCAFPVHVHMPPLEAGVWVHIIGRISRDDKGRCALDAVMVWQCDALRVNDIAKLSQRVAATVAQYE
ncbi:uncharacterized protein V1518DRAFT_426907 [Limtongia smithiae]|uniref:uncharacterized protein n=1 Tax=Limtongia smithiae TaxID=1125753 RepID=UPI0034CDAC61